MDRRDSVRRCLEENGVEIGETGEFLDVESINFISALVSIEEAFGFEFPDEYLLSGLLPTLDSICELIAKIKSD